MKNLKTILMGVAVMFAAPSMAQSSYENVAEDTTVENLTVGTEYQNWLSKYENVGNEINEISEQYQKEVDKRGYPKKKTVQAKIALVGQYIQLLEEQRDNPALNQNLDTEKVQRKIDLWQNQLDALNGLLKKI